MINTKRPNTDNYTQVGFIEAKDSNGVYQNIDHIYDNQGNIVFQQGYLNEYQGADNFGIPAIGKPLIDYTIWGNTKQDGFPTYDNPVEPEFCGERTENLFGGTLGELFPLQIPEGTNVFVSKLGSGGIVRLYDENKNEVDYWSFRLNETHQLYTRYFTAVANIHYVKFPLGGTEPFLTYSSTYVPYEPYGYKIPISSGGNNLAWTGWAEDCVQRVGTTYATLDGNVFTFAANISYGDFDHRYIFKINWKENTQYTISFMYKRDSRYNKSSTIGIIYTDGSSTPFPQYINDGEWHYMSFTTAQNKTVKYIIGWLTNGNASIDVSTFMVNEGSIALPYEPYVTPTVKNIYLGQVQTTRRIKKLVLTGEENWWTYGKGYYTSSTFPSIDNVLTTICTHFQCYPNKSLDSIQESGFNGIRMRNGYFNLMLRDDELFGAGNVEGVKNYLAQQYAAGTPVTVWYVLAEPETGIVNEPLCRIGDYADSVDFSQAGVEIPTLKKPNTTVIDVETSLEPSEVDVTYRGATKPKYDLFLAKNGDSFEAKDGQSLYIGGNP